MIARAPSRGPFAEVVRDVERLVTERWAVVEQIAEGLQRGTLEGNEVERMLQDA